MEDKKVSILVPVYGVEKYIERCARSLFEQTYDNIEYIFVDDCTQDRSIDILEEVLEKYPNRKKQVKILHHVKNRGLSASRNTALDASTGEYLMHVDSDDYIECDTICRLVKSALDKSSDIIICGYKRVYKDLMVNCLPNKIYDMIDYRHKVISGDASHTVWGKLIKASLYKDHNIRAIEGLHQGEDYAVYPKLVHVAQSVDYVDDCCYNYVMRNSLSTLKISNIQDTADCINEIKEYLLAQGELSLYADSLEQYSQKMKCWLINTWIVSAYRNRDIAYTLHDAFPTTKVHCFLRMDIKITLFLFNHRLYILLRIVGKIRSSLQVFLKRTGKQV